MMMMMMMMSCCRGGEAGVRVPGARAAGTGAGVGPDPPAVVYGGDWPSRLLSGALAGLA